jgi:NADP-dependent 3-hydroxy acid dehydrogenase YdfG
MGHSLHWNGLLGALGAALLVLSWWRRRAAARRAFGLAEIGQKTGNVSIVTGAGSGIGAEICVQLAARGGRVLLCGRTRGPLEAVLAQCQEARKQYVTAHGGDISIPAFEVAECDVTSSEHCVRAVQQCLDHFGRIDAVYANAGRGCLIPCADLPLTCEPLREMMEVNYVGAVQLILSALPHLRETEGRIVAVSSLGSLIPASPRAPYSASKGTCRHPSQLSVTSWKLTPLLSCPEQFLADSPDGRASDFGHHCVPRLRQDDFSREGFDSG